MGPHWTPWPEEPIWCLGDIGKLNSCEHPGCSRLKSADYLFSTCFEPGFRDTEVKCDGK